MLSAGASPSTSSPTGNYAVSKITIAQVYVLLSTLKAKKDDPAEYENKVNRLNKVRNCPSIAPVAVAGHYCCSSQRPIPMPTTVVQPCLILLHLCLAVIFLYHFFSFPLSKCLSCFPTSRLSFSSPVLT